MSVQVKIYAQQVLTFADDAVVKVRLRQKVDLTGGGLPEVDLEVILHSEAPLRLQNEQKLELYRSGGLQATVYAGECTRLGEKLYRIRGRRQLEYLQTEYLGGIYEEVSPYTLLDQLLEGRDYELAVPLSDVHVTGYLPRCNRQEAVRQLAVSMGAVVCAKREGTLWLRTPEYEDTQVLESGRILGENSLQMLPEYTRFELAAHSYTQGQFPVKLRDQVEYPAGLTTIYVSSPHYNYYTEDAYSNYVEEEGPNYVVVSQHGRMTLYAYPYIKETTYHTLPGAENGDYSLVQTVRDVTLIHNGNVQSLLQRMQTMGQLRLRATLTYGAAPDQELPMAGDPVELPTAWGTKLRGYIQKSDLLVTHDTLKLELTVACKEEKA